MHDGSAGVPTVAEYLAAHLTAGQTLLLDGACVPAKTARAYAEALAKNGAALKSCDVAGPIWDASGERPALPATPCWLLTPAQTGATAAQRIEMVRADLAKAGATALARAFMVPYSPMPAPILSLGSMLDTQVDIPTVQHTKPKPLTTRAATTTAG